MIPSQNEKRENENKKPPDQKVAKVENDFFLFLSNQLCDSSENAV